MALECCPTSCQMKRDFRSSKRSTGHFQSNPGRLHCCYRSQTKYGILGGWECSDELHVLSSSFLSKGEILFPAAKASIAGVATHACVTTEQAAEPIRQLTVTVLAGGLMVGMIRLSCHYGPSYCLVVEVHFLMIARFTVH